MTQKELNYFATEWGQLFVAYNDEEAREFNIVDVRFCLDPNYCNLNLYRIVNEKRIVRGFCLPTVVIEELINKGECCYKDNLYFAKTLSQLYKIRDREQAKHTTVKNEDLNGFLQVMDETTKKQEDSIKDGTITVSCKSIEELDEKLAKKEDEQKEKTKSLQLRCVELIDCVVAVRWAAPRNVFKRLQYDAVSPTLAKVETWGLLVNVLDDCIAVAQNVSEQDNEREYPSEVQNIIAIPLSGIKNIQQVINIEED